jgi:hypothetical protein
MLTILVVTPWRQKSAEHVPFHPLLWAIRRRLTVVLYFLPECARDRPDRYREI